MARTSKPLQPVDARIAALLKSRVDDADLTLRELSTRTGMSVNRLGIVLRQSPPPATVGEVELIARATGSTASRIIAEAESASNVTRLEDHAAVTIHPEGVRSADKLAAKKGRRKADQPHAE